ncbi:DUF6318 family protein [Arthrobacter sp. N1]|uniref:DUF6318 family protein n=1 Tax=Arthrobacter sp. N1 TaxID=619291 RepID=UPI003BB165F7
MVFVRTDGQGLGRVAAALAGGAVAVMLLSGCQGDTEPTPTAAPSAPQASASATPTGDMPTASPTAAATPRPSPASSAGPATNLPVPVKPALADENTAAGLEAFTKYWFELFSYGYETNDWAPFEAVTDPGCGTCSNVVAAVQKIYQPGGWVVGAQSEVTAFSTDFRANTQGSVSSFVEVVQSETTTFSESGGETGNDSSKAPSTNITFAIFDDTQWLMLDFGPPEGSE